MTWRLTIYVFFCLLVFQSEIASAQESPKVGQNMVYLEAFGYGGLASLNYERVAYTKGIFQLGPRVGLGINRFMDYRPKFNPDFAIPFGVCFAVGKNWKAEFGLGTTFSSVVQVGDDLEPLRQTLVHGNANVGVRYQKPDGGFILRAGYAPIFEKFSHLRHWPYLALGLSF